MHALAFLIINQLKEKFINASFDTTNQLTCEEYNSTCIEGIAFKKIIIDDNTEILGQD